MHGSLDGVFCTGINNERKKYKTEIMDRWCTQTDHLTCDLYGICRWWWGKCVLVSLAVCEKYPRRADSRECIAVALDRCVYVNGVFFFFTMFRGFSVFLCIYRKTMIPIKMKMKMLLGNKVRVCFIQYSQFEFDECAAPRYIYI